MEYDFFSRKIGFKDFPKEKWFLKGMRGFMREVEGGI